MFWSEREEAVRWRVLFDMKMTGIRRRLRTALDAASYTCGLLHWRERQMRNGLTVLMYHRVLPADVCRDYPLQSLIIPDDVFAEQVRSLTARYDILPVRDAIAELKKKRSLKRPIVSVTFDDGYFDNHSIASAILESHSVCGTFFVTSGFVSDSEPLWFDRAADCWIRIPEQRRQPLLGALVDLTGIRPPPGSDGRDIDCWMEALKRADIGVRNRFVDLAAEVAPGTFPSTRYRSMSVEDIRTLAAKGHEIASHTVTHPILTQLDDNELSRELREARAAIEYWTGEPVGGFCYPNGDYDRRVQEAVKQAGYVYACTTETGLNELNTSHLELKRIAITQQRVADCRRQHHELGFRAEVSRLREFWR